MPALSSTGLLCSHLKESSSAVLNALLIILMMAQIPTLNYIYQNIYHPNQSAVSASEKLVLFSITKAISLSVTPFTMIVMIGWGRCYAVLE